MLIIIACRYIYIYIYVLDHVLSILLCLSDVVLRRVFRIDDSRFSFNSARNAATLCLALWRQATLMTFVFPVVASVLDSCPAYQSLYPLVPPKLFSCQVNRLIMRNISPDVIH